MYVLSILFVDFEMLDEDNGNHHHASGCGFVMLSISHFRFILDASLHTSPTRGNDSQYEEQKNQLVWRCRQN